MISLVMTLAMPLATSLAMSVVLDAVHAYVSAEGFEPGVTAILCNRHPREGGRAKAP